ncbi:MAG TPA: hypothetical protein VJJ21_03940 [Candidatus Nanoarchaeia archaeon]|nr:hypothetical protein [Candidatus Nanoarchaeia archaeon]
MAKEQQPSLGIQAILEQLDNCPALELRNLLTSPRLRRELHNMSVVEEISQRPGFLGDFWERVQETYNREMEERARQSMEECKTLGRLTY